MAAADTLQGAFQQIGNRADDDMSERDVENLFLESGFYDALGYEGTGTDIRSEQTLPDHRRPDYVTLDSNESVTAVYEFKTTGRSLTDNRDQLFSYVDTLKANYGVLTNGETLQLYQRGQSNPILTVPLTEATDTDAQNVASALQKPDWDITDAESVNEFLDGLDPIQLDSELGREHFFETFRLEQEGPFAELVTASMDLLHELRDEQNKKFVEGAYEFWEMSYASEPDDVPDSWETFMSSSDSLKDFMFCLESGHAMLSRLLLAKAADDYDFFPNPVMEGFFDNIQGFGNEIELDMYPAGANRFLERMRTDLVESLFEDDIFVWWMDGYGEAVSTLRSSSERRLESVIEENTEATSISQATKERFSRAVAHVLYSIMKFDFAAVEGDPLGNLYQRYFHPETRKALGEFYTPQPVIEYIMDGVGYDTGISNEQLIDPSCGSGTFLVEAVNRYLDDVRRFDDDPDWETELRELCTRPQIVGLDIHPFAVLMAQIRFMIAILPEYREAKRANESFTIRRLPIFRTDTLRNERKGAAEDISDDGTRQLSLNAITEDEQDLQIPVPLPVEANEGEETEPDSDFLVRRVRMPKLNTITPETGGQRFGEYFAAVQGVLDVVKLHMSNDRWEYSGGLREAISRYTSRNYDGVAEFFASYVDDILETVRYLKDEHNDGRLFKMFEDTVLALVVKNYMNYEYVVGNPPYVRIQNLPDHQKEYLDDIYETTTGNYDLYCPFYERGFEWLTEGSGTLGFITPNQFMVTDYGDGLRDYMAENVRIEEMYDFRDSGVFEDATNYPLIVIAEDEPGVNQRQDNEVRCVRVKSNVDDDSGRELDEQIIETVRNNRGRPGYSGEYIDVFDFPQAELGDGYWSPMPSEELEVFRKLEQNSDSRLEEVTDSVFAGTQTSANKVYIVTPVNADKISPDESGATVRVIPSGESREYEVEADLICPWLQGRDVERWRGDWSGQHVILPYDVSMTNDGELEWDLHSADYIRNHLPLTWEYFEEHRDKLEGRESGRFRDRDDWYAFGYPKSMDRFENPKLVNAEIADEATFMLDDVGEWYFKSGYGIQLIPRLQERTRLLSALLNSNTLDFYLKHIASIKAGGYYKYTSHYLEKLPVAWSDETVRSEIGDLVDQIVEAIDLDNRTERFPEAYLGEFDGQLEYIDYEWQTRRYPVDASIQDRGDGTFAVEAGRTDSITGPQLTSEERAKYVHAAVDGRNVKSGEEMSIPIPRRDAGVQELLSSLEEDRETVAETDIAELEAEIDRAVYDLFELTESERDVIEEYLSVF